jgi:hypothetical protein
MAVVELMRLLLVAFFDYTPAQGIKFRGAEQMTITTPPR